MSERSERTELERRSAYHWSLGRSTCIDTDGTLYAYEQQGDWSLEFVERASPPSSPEPDPDAPEV